MDLFTALFVYSLPILLIYLSYRYIWRGAKASLLPRGWRLEQSQRLSYGFCARSGASC